MMLRCAFRAAAMRAAAGNAARLLDRSLVTSPVGSSSTSAASTSVGQLSAEQVQQFREQGYLVVPGFNSPETLDALRREAERIVMAADINEASIFTTQNQTQNTDAYFLTSGDKIRCFFEEKGRDVGNKLLSINKIGHALHVLNPVFRKFCFSEPLRNVVRSLGYKDPRLAQTMYIFKQPRIGGAVAMHQDHAFLQTDPPSVTGLWFALENATRNNGCLFAIPGSHKAGTRRHFNLTPDGQRTVWQPPEAEPWDERQLVPLEVPAGTLVLLHGDLVHSSYANLSDESRHAFTMHLIEGTARWRETNWMRVPPGFEFPSLYRTVA